jgi:uncharacterized membrane protein
MAEECPHCGAQLPLIADAFCAECRQPLEEAPLIRRLEDKIRKVAWPDVDYPGLILSGLGFILVTSTFVRLAIRFGEWEEWMWWYEGAWGVLGFVLLAIGVWRLNR